KTTTLYTALKRLNTPDVNIVTVEDPVEVRMPMVRQVQVNAEIGMTFAGALRSILRQDPDIVLVGEIRDDETARIAVQAALTGHLVLSSLHTNDAAGAIPRLRDLGVPGFAVNAALRAVVAQRLARRVCDGCAKPAEPPPSLLARFGPPAHGGSYVRGAGCGKCGSSGYRGRAGLYEVLDMTDAVRRTIESDGGAAAVLRAARASGMRLMWEDGVQKARLGITTLEEVARTAGVALDEEVEPPQHARPSRRAA
ncbi:MAG: Flp pilus assembly complex ATPase component TadA, partial [Phycisphaeraceae bacterium]|nr:Flp pilus assembly complex ATPase component TadA [Phycisphaeraceae bacterium]